MRIIIGYGNTLRGEDAFGVDVLRELEKLNLKETKLITLFQLTPEIVLELLEADEVIFVDAAFCTTNQYQLACPISIQNDSSLSHHISPKTLINMLNTLYHHYPKYLLYSMQSSNFEKIKNQLKYEECIQHLLSHFI